VADVTAKGLKILMSIRSSKKFAVAAALAMSTVAASTANAALMQMTYTGTGSGTLNGTAFTNAAFTFTALADTANVVTASSNQRYNAHTSTDFTIAGVGAGSITTTLFTVNSDLGIARILDLTTVAGTGNGRFFSIAYMAPSWNMLTDFSLTNGSVGQPGGVLPSIATTAGDLQFSSFVLGVGTGTFNAVLNPVPAPGAIALLGLAGLAGRRRR
jgi:hypothetical protein